jgi:hypothetical protein
MSRYPNEEIERFDQQFARDDDEEDERCGSGFTVSMKGAPNMATVQWTRSAEAAIKKTAREWGCKESDLYIYRGHDE